MLRVWLGETVVSRHAAAEEPLPPLMCYYAANEQMTGCSKAALHRVSLEKGGRKGGVHEGPDGRGHWMCKTCAQYVFAHKIARLFREWPAAKPTEAPKPAAAMAVAPAVTPAAAAKSWAGVAAGPKAAPTKAPNVVTAPVAKATTTLAQPKPPAPRATQEVAERLGEVERTLTRGGPKALNEWSRPHLESTARALGIPKADPPSKRATLAAVMRVAECYELEKIPASGGGRAGRRP